MFVCETANANHVFRALADPTAEPSSRDQQGEQTVNALTSLRGVSQPRFQAPHRAEAAKLVRIATRAAKLTIAHCPMRWPDGGLLISTALLARPV